MGNKETRAAPVLEVNGRRNVLHLQCFGTSGDELRARSPWKTLKSAVGISHLHQWRRFTCKTWTIRITKSRFQYTNSRTRDMAANTSFRIKTALFQALVCNFLATFPLNTIRLASPPLSMTCVLPDKLSCSEIILRNRSDAFKTQHQWPGLAMVRETMCYGRHQAVTAVSQTIAFKDALMMSSWRRQTKCEKET